MRQIKFRAKRIDNGEWVYGHYVEQSGYHYIIEQNNVIETTADARTVLARIPFYVIDESTLGQFAGRCDKKGKAIYDGDILERKKFPIYLNPFMERREVKWFDEFGGFQCVGSYTSWCIPLEEFPHAEIIGNITDNKELLS